MGESPIYSMIDASAVYNTCIQHMSKMYGKFYSYTSCLKSEGWAFHESRIYMHSVVLRLQQIVMYQTTCAQATINGQKVTMTQCSVASEKAIILL